MNDDFIYGVKGNWPRDCQQILVKPVYEKAGPENWTKIVDKKGQHGECLIFISPQKLRLVSSRGIDSILLEKNTIWYRFYETFLEIGLSKEDIGLFGSRRIQFKNTKDADFIVYGIENAKKTFEHVNLFKRKTNSYNITFQHASYQAETHGKLYEREVNSLELCLMNKWSSCMIGEGICSTIRFVDKISNDKNFIKHIFEVNEPLDSIEGVVFDAIYASFFPRRFMIKTTENKVYEVISPLWIFHQCVRDNQKVIITGIISKNTIIVRDYNHGIKIV
jgi:hypothetical protein